MPQLAQALQCNVCHPAQQAEEQQTRRRTPRTERQRSECIARDRRSCSREKRALAEIGSGQQTALGSWMAQDETRLRAECKTYR